MVLLFQVLENELQALQKACEELGHDYRPGITFVVVQKRHRVRFFPVDDRDKVCVPVHSCAIVCMSHSCMLSRLERVGMFQQEQQWIIKSPTLPTMTSTCAHMLVFRFSIFMNNRVVCFHFHELSSHAGY